MRYSRELQVAIETASIAGRAMRTAFHATGHTLTEHGLDASLEAMIREPLGAAFPSYGQLGEELPQADRLATDEQAHVWVIDPLDGSTHFEKCRRGAALSIALLRAGEPVLGVVFSPLYPNDKGDMIAWCEGQGLIRNGVPVHRRPLASALSSGHTVLTAPGAERDVKGNAEIVSPARFRGMPSIAYRLALLAVGEAEASYSINGPVSWDYAGGHALLRGVGGDLFDADGKPVVYGHDGRGGCGGIGVGGTSTVANELLERLRQRRLGGHRSSSRKTLDLRGRTIEDAGQLSRAQGCLLGQLAGDSLGSLVEFQSSERIKASYPHGIRELQDGGTWGTLPGQPTDDSELALALARSLIEVGDYEGDAVARAYATWYSSSPFDMGSTTSMAFSAAARATSEAALAAQNAANKQSQANGALMRISPLAIFGCSLPKEILVKLARYDASLSHPHKVCQDVNAVYVVAIQHALKSGDPGEKVYRFVRAWAKTQDLDNAVMDWLRAAETSAPSDYQSQMGWCKIAFQNAFYQLLHASCLAEGVEDTVLRGGDTDTNACIAGALMGAVYGIEAVPFPWVDRVLTCRPMAGFRGVRRPRPVTYWPTDALELAEGLLDLSRKKASLC